MATPWDPDYEHDKNTSDTSDNSWSHWVSPPQQLRYPQKRTRFLNLNLNLTMRFADANLQTDVVK